MKIGFLSSHFLDDRNSFSGCIYYMYQAIQSLEDAEIVAIAETFHSRTRIYNFIGRLIGKFGNRKSFLVRAFRKYLANQCLRSANADLLRNKVDVVIAPVGANLLAHLDPRVKTLFIYATDATPQFVQESSAIFSPTGYAEALACERLALQRAARVMYSSHYMADRACHHDFSDVLSQCSEKVQVIPWGLNMDTLPEFLGDRPRDELRLLFVGKQWLRKGGDIALETLQILQEKGYKAQLTIIGSDPAEARNLPGVTVIPFLDKNKPEESAQYVEQLKRSHFLILPTRSDCTPMVIAEANAYGVPVITTDVGGIGTLVHPGINGYMVSLEAPAEDYATCIATAFDDPVTYQTLTQGSRTEYLQRLNWKAWAQSVYQVCLELHTAKASVGSRS